MPKPSAADLQAAAKALDLAGFDYQVVLDPTLGTIRLNLDSKVAPGHVRNMVALAESGYYDGGCFHRIIKGFMIQGGCPEGTGTGGPGYRIAAEFNDTPHDKGIVSLAHGDDPGSGDTSFFVVTARTPVLDGKYTAFGRVAEGMDVIEKIEQVPVNGETPVMRVELKKVTVFKQP